ncbi:unnamed protein product [Paramecium pentaurelia]|uniref:Uncharacterized protein n=1 Tax=Paramecium pentaurelia TaxID=43138 RepID=A0A8S1VW41_9CILI|nr:unnamed protein product [Paramecium pentaurelia]
MEKLTIEQLFKIIFEINKDQHFIFCYACQIRFPIVEPEKATLYIHHFSKDHVYNLSTIATKEIMKNKESTKNDNRISQAIPLFDLEKALNIQQQQSKNVLHQYLKDCITKLPNIYDQLELNNLEAYMSTLRRLYLHLLNHNTSFLTLELCFSFLDIYKTDKDLQLIRKIVRALNFPLSHEQMQILNPHKQTYPNLSQDLYIEYYQIFINDLIDLGLSKESLVYHLAKIGTPINKIIDLKLYEIKNKINDLINKGINEEQNIFFLTIIEKLERYENLNSHSYVFTKWNTECQIRKCVRQIRNRLRDQTTDEKYKDFLATASLQQIQNWHKFQIQNEKNNTKEMISILETINENKNQSRKKKKSIIKQFTIPNNSNLEQFERKEQEELENNEFDISIIDSKSERDMDKGLNNKQINQTTKQNSIDQKNQQQCEIINTESQKEKLENYQHKALLKKSSKR